MNLVYAFAIAAQMGCGVYLLLSRHGMRILIGIVLLSTATNLLIFVAGGLRFTAPPVIEPGLEVLAAETANALPQALILTAIVISFSFFAFLLVLAYRAYQELGTDEVDAMRLAEPAREPPPPGGY